MSHQDYGEGRRHDVHAAEALLRLLPKYSAAPFWVVWPRRVRTRWRSIHPRARSRAISFWVSSIAIYSARWAS